mgnify:CR=1 FL=1
MMNVFLTFGFVYFLECTTRKILIDVMVCFNGLLLRMLCFSGGRKIVRIFMGVMGGVDGEFEMGDRLIIAFLIVLFILFILL